MEHDYPVQARARLDEPLSRWLWLVKWLLVCFAAVTLLFAGRYPRGLHDFIVGMNRWVIRVIAYAALMTDAYPPFRLDQGGTDALATPAPDDHGPGSAAWAPLQPHPSPSPHYRPRS
jgi:hypothetical protein